jgi:hypothetical protein
MSFVTQIFHNDQPSHGGDRKIFEVMTSTLSKGTLGSVASLLAAILYLIYVPLVVNTSRSFPHLRLITGFVTRLTRRLPLVEQELLTLPEHLSSPLVIGINISSCILFPNPINYFSLCNVYS